MGLPSGLSCGASSSLGDQYIEHVARRLGMVENETTSAAVSGDTIMSLYPLFLDKRSIPTEVIAS
jgi:hypothetical protein